MAGVDVGLATDKDDKALAVLAEALGVTTLAAPVIEVLERRLLDVFAGNAPGMLIGGPPCTPFSHAGFWMEGKREGRDPDADLLDAYLEALRQLRPGAFVLENVPGLKFRTHHHFLDKLVSGASDVGYEVSAAVLNAAHFGVPQARRRLFVVGVLGGPSVDLVTWPSWPERSAAWAIGDLEGEAAEPDERVNGRYGDLLDRVPPGGNYLVFTERYGHVPGLFRYRGRYWSFLLKLDPGRPSPTLPAQRVTYNGPFHWTSRHLRIREMARLQGFPDWYPTNERLPVARRHLGNAVPPLLAAGVIWRVRQAMGQVPEDVWPHPLAVAASPGASVHDVLGAYRGPGRSSRNLKTGEPLYGEPV